MPANSEKYDLEERTAKFGEDVIRFCKQIVKNEITLPIIGQLIRCGTSVGANYCEADNAETKKDFAHKIGICKKEFRECMHFLRMSAIASPDLADSARLLWRAAKELSLIFNKIFRSSRNL